MDFKNYENVSLPYKKQIEKVVEVFKDVLKDSLVGVYLHGSMTLNCFVEGISDIDFIVVCSKRICPEERIEIAGHMVELNQKPASIEISAILTEHLNPWHYPTPCQFHFSDYWDSTYRDILLGNQRDHWIVNNEFEDPDVACHVRVINQCGLCLTGDEIDVVFPIIPEEDFWKSIAGSIDEVDFNAYGEKYFTSEILILCRVWHYKVEKVIVSKYDVGLWALERIPDKQKYIVENALESRYCGAEEMKCDMKDLEELQKFVINQIQK